MRLSSLKSQPTLADIPRRVQASPRLSDLMKKVDELPTPNAGLRYYKPLLHKLKDEKGLTGSEIKVWLYENNCGEYSTGQIYKMLRKRT